jgi:hypothetical protein
VRWTIAACSIAALIAWAAAQAPETNKVRFVDVTASAGIQFKHDNAASAEKYLIETMGSGAAWLDFDNDGYMDLFLVNSSATSAYKPPKPLRSALYRNNGDGSFTDVTSNAGTGAEGLFGMGAAAGDFDNDGFPDLYIAGYGRSILYRNNGDGTFTDITAKAGVANAERWASSAAWFDYDRDGWLDLVVVNYLDFTPEKNVVCEYAGQRGYCHPNQYRGQRATLYRNNHNGTFTDVSRTSGIGVKPGNGLGVVCFDFDGDGWTDVFVANDSMENYLYRNRKNGTFEEVAFPAGVAVSEDGRAEAGMGVDAADFDGDGRLDLFVTHLDLEFNRLYRNLGDGSFEDASFRAKLGYSTYHLSGFGTRLLDIDNDGWRDIFIANGHVLDNVRRYHADTAYAEPKTVFRNLGGTFRDVTSELGPDLLEPRVSRGAAVADYDNDGDLDILVTNNGQAPQLLRNDGGNRKHWLQVRLIGTRSNRDGIGAVVRIAAGGRTQFDQAKGGMSYQSAHDPRLHFGLGDTLKVDVLEVKWPSGAVDNLTDLKADRVVTVKEGSGEVPSHYPPLRQR